MGSNICGRHAPCVAAARVLQALGRTAADLEGGRHPRPGLGGTRLHPSTTALAAFALEGGQGGGG
jgi:hypothetical protein